MPDLRPLRILALPWLLPGCGPPPGEILTPPACPDGYLLDADTCVPEACGAGSWGALPVDALTVYVDIAAADGGDGTADAPFTSAQAALDLAGARGGGLVAVAAGTYAEPLALTTDHAGVQLAGRCRELVTLDARGAGDETAGIEIESGYGEVEVSGLRVAASDFVGILVGSGVVRLSDVDVDGSGFIGVVAWRSTPIQTTALAMDRCRVMASVDVGVGAYDSGTAVTLRDTTIQGTLPPVAGGPGRGIEVRRGAALVAEGGEVADTSGLGILAYDDGTSVTLRDAVVRDTVPEGDDVSGNGVVIGGGTFLAEGCDVSWSTGAGVLAYGEASVTLRDTVIRDTQPHQGSWGFGVDVQDGATVVVEACELAGNTTVGALATGAGSALTLRDATVRDTLPVGDGDGGTGIQVQRGAALVLEGGEVVGNTMLGVLTTGEGTTATFRDTTIRGTSLGHGEKGMTAVGLVIEDGAQAEAWGLVTEENQGPGLAVGSPGSTFTCTACSLVANQFAGAVVLDGGTLALEAASIEGTLQSVNLGGGVGIWAASQWDWDPPALTLVDSVISGNPVAGVWVRGDGTYDISGSTIAGGPGLAYGAGTRCGDAVFAGNGVSAWDGTTGLRLVDDTLLDASGAGLFLDAGAATLEGTTFTGNASDLVVQGEPCPGAPAGWDGAGTATVCPSETGGYERPTCDLVYFHKLFTAEVE